MATLPGVEMEQQEREEMENQQELEHPEIMENQLENSEVFEITFDLGLNDWTGMLQNIIIIIINIIIICIQVKS
jgi:hypothetical protein